MTTLKVALGLGVLLSGTVAGQSSIPLYVSATIPPRPCVYPAPCPSSRFADRTTVSVSIRRGQVRYVGPTPEVRRRGDLVTVNF